MLTFQTTNLKRQVENKIKALPTLKDKVQAIAINSHLIEKPKIDEELTEITTKLEIDNRNRYTHLLDEINNIVAGEHTFTDADFEDQEVLTEEENKARHNYYKNEGYEDYWFNVLIQSELTVEEIKEIDEPVLKFLRRVTAVRKNDQSLKVVFTFAENEWFTNKTLTKEFEIDGDDIKRSFGDEINWKEGKNITVKTIKKKNKKGKKTVQKEVESFFNFFKGIDLISDNQDKEDAGDQDEDDNEDEIEKMEKQYEIANSLYEFMVPKSMEYALGVVASQYSQTNALGNVMGMEDDEEESNAKKSKAKKQKGKAPRKGSNASDN